MAVIPRCLFTLVMLTGKWISCVRVCVDIRACWLRNTPSQVKLLDSGPWPRMNSFSQGAREEKVPDHTGAFLP